MIKPIGHFRVWRELFTKPIWLNSTLEQQTILITLMAMANFNEKEWEWKGQKFEVQPGQFITSLESIRLNTGGKVSIQNIRTALNRFEKLGFLTNQSTKTGRLITLVNWQDYQYVEGESNKGNNKDLTKSQQRPNKDLTKSQQRPNKDLTPKEESKKERKKESNNKTSLEISNFRLRYSDSELKIIDEYFDILRWTRKSGVIADSIYIGQYKYWEKHSIPKVIYGLKTYIGNPKHHDKRENYTNAIIRNATAEQVADKKETKPKRVIVDQNPFLNRR